MIRRLPILVLTMSLTVVVVLAATVRNEASRSPDTSVHAAHNHHERAEQPGNAVSPRQSSDRRGAPGRGQDPAMQRQASLALAASRPHGSGQRTDTPAANVKGTYRRVDPASVLPDLKKTGMTVNGCLVGYGIPGVQCLPARAPGNLPMTCSQVSTLFSGGIPVTGFDRLKLDSNNDGIACGNGDIGLPSLD